MTWCNDTLYTGDDLVYIKLLIINSLVTKSERGVGEAVHIHPLLSENTHTHMGVCMEWRVNGDCPMYVLFFFYCKELICSHSKCIDM